MYFFKYLGTTFILLAALVFAGCDVNEGPFEKAGENIDNTIDEVQDKVEETKEKLEN